MDKSLIEKAASELVDEFRAKTLSPKEYLQECIKNIESSKLNAFCFTDFDKALSQAENVDLTKPFAGIPFGIKELDHVKNWPYSEASVVFKDRVSDFTSTYIKRLQTQGAILLGQTTASEFGGVNCTHTKLHGTTRNPWNVAKTPGGSSGGSAAAVSGGLVPIATGGDGGGSIRIPAGFTNLVGLKVTYGRIPKGPHADIGALTAVMGCLSKTIRDTARFLDVTSGFDIRDPLSLPKTGNYEANLGKVNVKGLKVAVSLDLFGAAVVSQATQNIIASAAENLIKAAELKQVDPPKIRIPSVGMEWAASNMASLLADLGDLYPGCEKDLTPEIMFGLNIAYHHYDLKWAANGYLKRIELNEAMASIFEEVDLVIAATNPDVAFQAEGPLPTVVDEIDLIKERGMIEGTANNGALTIPSNIYGNPAISLPAGFVDGLPVGMQIIAKHHEEPILLELGLLYENSYPWPRCAPNAPC
jgi:aspartyl-tRNA(Asn)/glutamyl-tRNA(Gln) amidotransferase subunit A